LAELAAYAPAVRVDTVLANDAPLPPQVAAAYRATGAEPVTAPARWTGPGELVVRPLLRVTADGTVRHEPEALAAALAELLPRQG
jgi:hypothetical protein